MKIKKLMLVALPAAAGLVGLGQLMGCGSPAEEDPTAEASLAALRACHLDDGTVEPHAALHACDPGNTKKTTICHIPPGNPANAHTLCIGNAAVPAHLANHGDHLGACENEKPCTPPPGGTGGSGTPATGGSCGSQSETCGSGGASGTGGTGGVVIIIP